jgi:hypothetical protein
MELNLENILYDKFPVITIIELPNEYIKKIIIKQNNLAMIIY